MCLLSPDLGSVCLSTLDYFHQILGAMHLCTFTRFWGVCLCLLSPDFGELHVCLPSSALGSLFNYFHQIWWVCLCLLSPNLALLLGIVYVMYVLLSENTKDATSSYVIMCNCCHGAAVTMVSPWYSHHIRCCLPYICPCPCCFNNACSEPGDGHKLVWMTITFWNHHLYNTFLWCISQDNISLWLLCSKWFSLPSSLFEISGLASWKY